MPRWVWIVAGFGLIVYLFKPGWLQSIKNTNTPVGGPIGGTIEKPAGPGPY